MCPLGAVKALRAAALHDGAGPSDLRHGLRSYERDCAAKTNARCGLRWRHSLRKKRLFSNVRWKRHVEALFGKNPYDISERLNPF